MMFVGITRRLGILWVATVSMSLAEPLSTVAQQVAIGAFRWVQKDGRSIALVNPDGVVWRFNFGPKQTKPNFYPLGLPGGPSLVVDRPADHAWHHGLWFSWKFIDGINFWEPDKQTRRPLGRTEWTDVDATLGADHSAEIKFDLTYSVPEKTALLTEQRTLLVSAPHKDGQYSIDWLSEFRAANGNVTLAAVPIPPAKDGVSWGGYSGLSVRFANELDQRLAHTAESQVSFDNGVYRGKSVALDYSGMLTGHTAGIAILDHPMNPRHPADWYAIRSKMGYVNAALLSNQPLVLKPGERFALRYRVVIHAGRWNPTRLQTEYQEFVKP